MEIRASPIATKLMPDGDQRDFTIDVKNVAGQIIWQVTLSLVSLSGSRASEPKRRKQSD